MANQRDYSEFPGLSVPFITSWVVLARFSQWETKAKFRKSKTCHSSNMLPHCFQSIKKCTRKYHLELSRSSLNFGPSDELFVGRHATYLSWTDACHAHWRFFWSALLLTSKTVRKYYFNQDDLPSVKYGIRTWNFSLHRTSPTPLAAVYTVFKLGSEFFCIVGSF